MDKIAVIGAGVSGLSTAQLLLTKGFHPVVFERESVPGGLIKCKRIDGSLFHTCGGHVFNSKRQDVLEWFWSKFQREEEFSKADRNSVVFLDDTGDTIIPYPIENHAYLLDADIQKHFIDDLLTMANAENQYPNNFEDFLRGRFGETLYKLYFQPYNEKVWRRNLRQVPISWLIGKLPMPSVEEIIFNNFNHVEEKTFVHSTFWYEKKDGSQFIANRLADGLDVIYSQDIQHIEYDGHYWHILGGTFDKVIFCGNIKDLVKAIKGVDVSAYSERIETLEYHGTTAVFCEIDKTPYSWIYQPSRNHESHRIICTGNFASSNNDRSMPINRSTATIEFTDKVPMNDIINNLAKMPLHPKYLAHQYNKYTYPIQDNNTRDMIQNLKEFLTPFGFYFTGRFADWEYYNMDVAIGAAIDLVSTLNK